ncbi:MAG: hypothetical protein GX352_03895 [Clostridiales bacterium]|nr:hypothetical protein [Clostridiales bacterium]
MGISNIYIPQRIRSIMDSLIQAGYEAYAVGGCVRDSLLGQEPQDWDIATSARPQEIKKVFCNYRLIETGLKHGTVTVIFDGEAIEITTYRIDVGYSDKRRPDKIVFTSQIIEDLARRDFTINACAANEQGIVDPFMGIEDIQNRLIRCVGNPRERLKEDALRIMRGIRLASVLDFQVEEDTREAMLESTPLLKNISWERITEELSKTLLGIRVKKVLWEFKEVISFIIPEISIDEVCPQYDIHNSYDIYLHSLKAVDLAKRDKLLRVSLFFHDVAKIACLSQEDNSNYDFRDFAELSVKMTEKILKRMRFPNRDIQEITILIKNYNRKIIPSLKNVRRVVRELGKARFERLLKFKRAHALAEDPSSMVEELRQIDDLKEIYTEIVTKGLCVDLKDLAINGHDLIELGIPQGKGVGRLLKKLLDMVLSGELENTKPVLLEQAKKSLI